MNYQYSYLIFTGLFALIWAVFYILRKDTRKEMLFMGLLFGIGGVLSQLVYVKDWWKPMTITNTLVGVEDFLIGFFIGGIASVIYNIIYKKKVKLKKRNYKRYILIVFVITFFGCFYFLKINSFYSSVIAFLSGILFIWIKRKDLIISSAITGFLLLIIGVGCYLILDNLLQPGVIKEFWYLKESWYSSLLLGIPLGEYIWFFLAGAFIGPLYEYGKEGKLIKIKDKLNICH